MEIIYFILIAIILIVFRILLNKYSVKMNKKQKKEINIIIAPYSYRGLGFFGVVCGTLTITLLFISAKTKEKFLQAVIANTVVFLPLLIFAVLLTLYAYFWRIEFKDNKLIYTNLFNKKKFYNIYELEVRFKRRGFLIYKNQKKLLKFHYVTNNSVIILKYLNKKLK